MLKKISFPFAGNAMITLLSLVMVYHLLIITGTIPYKAAWGGRLQSREDMLRFETVSIVVNLLILTVILVKTQRLKIKAPSRFVNILLWLFSVLFAINTVGNLASINIWELVIFTPLTALSSLLCARLAIEK